MQNILIVEDDEGLSRGVSFIFQKAGYNTSIASTISSAKKILAENMDMVILDLNLPDGDGIDFCRHIRQSSNIPIIMLTARDMESDEVLGLTTGADDYITKPFTLSVLQARVDSIFRRLNNKQNILMSNTLVLNTENMKVFKDSIEICLSSTEYKLLKYFIENKNQVLLKERLLTILWDNDSNFVDENTLAVNIRRLRKKIEHEPSNPQYIKTIHGMGYIWCEG